MTRLLIVDDEMIVLESVSQVLKTHYDDIVIETAKNAREGLIKVEHFRPHIIMTDIRMPGMNGLEFIERIRKVDNQVKIIIVSAYDQFEFAKDAVKYNVEDYILKPLTKTKMIEVIGQTLLKIDSEEEKRHKELDHIERYYQSVSLVESNFFNSILLNRNFIRHIAHYREILEITLEKGRMVTIEFANLPSKANMDELNFYNQKINDCCDYLKTSLKFQMPSLISNPFLNRIFIYLEDKKGEDLNDRYFWSSFVQNITDRFGLRARIGLGEIKEIDRIYESYEEAILVLRQSDQQIAFVEDQKATHFSVDDFNELTQSLIDDFLTKQKRFKQSLRQYEFEMLDLMKQPELSRYAEANLLETMILIFDICKRANVQRDPDKTYISEFVDKPVAGKIQHFERVVEDLFDIYSKSRNGEYNDLTIAAMEIMQQDYHSEITLEGLAQQINVTPQYLSKIFKDDTGSTFKEYLNELRIEEAKKMLKEGKKSIKEIGFYIGYNDTSYFIRTFKKYEGITPKDYQRMIK